MLSSSSSLRDSFLPIIQGTLILIGVWYFIGPGMLKLSCYRIDQRILGGLAQLESQGNMVCRMTFTLDQSLKLVTNVSHPLPCPSDNTCGGRSDQWSEAEQYQCCGSYVPCLLKVVVTYPLIPFS